jgi:hypothetical protein
MATEIENDGVFGADDSVNASPFCMYGAYLSYKDFEDVSQFDDILAGDRSEGLDVIAYDDGAYVGIEWCGIRDNETGSEFKARIEASLKKLVGRSVKCNTWDFVAFA